MPEPKSKARKMQEASSQQLGEERRVPITIIDMKAYEYHLDAYESVVRGILDPDTPDVFIEVPVEKHLQGSVRHAYLHTSQVAKFYLHGDLTSEEKKPDNGDDTGKQKVVKGG